jgi:8-oxo-dGTP diphosphatase
MPQKTILVVGAIIKKDNKILICQRKNDSKFGSLKWEFPGGKVEFGESPTDALKREIKEELDLEISVNNLFDVVSHVYPNGAHIVLITYFCSIIGGSIKKLEVNDFAFVETQSLSSFDFLTADLPLIKKLQNESD